MSNTTSFTNSSNSATVATGEESCSSKESNNNNNDNNDDNDNDSHSKSNRTNRSSDSGGGGRHRHHHQDDSTIPRSGRGGRGGNRGGSRNKNNNNINSNKRNDNSNNIRKLSHALSWVLRHSAVDIGLPIRPDGYIPVQEILDCQHPRLRGIATSLDQIREVVSTSDKQRFRLEERPKYLYYPPPSTTTTTTATDAAAIAHTEGNDNGTVTTNETVLCIRANQGHSITTVRPDLLLTRLSADDVLSLPCIVHGTYIEAWTMGIEREGLKKMTRTHIHFAPGLPNNDKAGGGGVISGMRKSCTVYIYLDVPHCASAVTDGIIEFYRSDNGVILTAGIDNNGILPPEYFSHVVESSSGTLLMDNRRAEVPSDHIATG